MTYWFDMDGTIANLYAVYGWLDYLNNFSTRPYENALPMLNMSKLARRIHKVQKQGDKVGIISWTSKTGTAEYNDRVRTAKLKWLEKHLASVHFDAIHIVDYGTNKWSVCKDGILFDDEARNRNEWNNKQAFEPSQIFDIMD